MVGKFYRLVWKRGRWGDRFAGVNLKPIIVMENLNKKEDFELSQICVNFVLSN